MESTKNLLGPRTKEIKTILGPRNPRSTQDSTELTAQELCKRFGAETYKPFFYRAAWRLDHDTLMRLATTAVEKGNNPVSYFVAIVRREMRQTGVDRQA